MERVFDPIIINLSNKIIASLTSVFLIYVVI